jgi:hypothetical protein
VSHDVDESKIASKGSKARWNVAAMRVFRIVGASVESNPMQRGIEIEKRVVAFATARIEVVEREKSGLFRA